MRNGRNPWKKLLKHIKVSGRRNLKTKKNVTITERDLKEQFINQNGRCYWFKIKLNPKHIHKKSYPLSISADRLDNNRGYDKENVVICSRLANLGRGNCPPEIFRKIVRKLIK